MRPRPSAIRWIVATSLRVRYLVVVAAAAMMVFGVATLHNQRVDVFPEFAPPRVVIQTASLGLSTSDVEELVTVPLEQALRGVPGVTDLRSKSVPQLSSIEMLFASDTDLLKDRELVQERLATVAPSLPTWAAPPVMLAPVSATGRAMEIGMTSKNQSLIAMSMDAYWNIRARLQLVDRRLDACGEGLGVGPRQFFDDQQQPGLAVDDGVTTGSTLRTFSRWFGVSTLPPVPMMLPVENLSSPESIAPAVLSMTCSRVAPFAAIRFGSTCTVIICRRSFQIATLATPGTRSSRARMFQ